jgi:pimeloyl-ACP methyl ester carboxylesterase
MEPALNETAATCAPGGGQTRARYPDSEGILARGGGRIRWESYGRGTPTILLLPAWSIIHSRCWKMQIPELARSHHVLTFDPRGNGGSDRPTDPAAYAEDEFAADALALMDATDTENAVVVALSLGAQRALILAGEHPARVRGLVLVGPLFNLERPLGQERQAAVEFETDSFVDDGWGRYDAHSWRRDYPGFVEFFFGEVFSQPHSTKQIEDCVGWGLETDVKTLIAAEVPGLEAARTRELCARVSCPVLVVHGDKDAIVPYEIGVHAAALTGGRMVTLEGSGHCPHARDPVRFNILRRQFVSSLRVPAAGGD